jgi:hypothetical protein
MYVHFFTAGNKYDMKRFILEFYNDNIIIFHIENTLIISSYKIRSYANLFFQLHLYFYENLEYFVIIIFLLVYIFIR